METINNIIIYIFYPAPGKTFGYYYHTIALMIVLLALAAGIILYTKKNKDNKAFKKLFRAYPAKLLLMTIVFAIYIPARYYYVPFFSMRAMLYVIVAITITLLIKIGITWFKKYPIEKKKRDIRTEKNKYLIKKRKH